MKIDEKIPTKCKSRRTENPSFAHPNRPPHPSYRRIPTFLCKTNPISKTQKPPQTSMPQTFTPIFHPARIEKTNPIKPNFITPKPDLPASIRHLSSPFSILHSQFSILPSPFPNTRANQGGAEVLSEVPIYRGCTSGPKSPPWDAIGNTTSDIPHPRRTVFPIYIASVIGPWASKRLVSQEIRGNFRTISTFAG